MRLHRQSRQPHAFTLVEVMLSLSLMAIVIASAYACLSAGFAAQKLIEPRADVLQNGRVALALMIADLRSACALPGDTEFVGMPRKIGEIQADNLDFATHNYSPRHPGEGDFCEESLYLDRNPETGHLSLWRRRNPLIGIEPFSGGRREEIATGVRGLAFEYSDGLEWHDSWGDTSGRGKQESSMRYRSNLHGLPEAVRITLMLEATTTRTKRPTENPEPPLVFRTVTRLNLATSSFNSSSGSATNSGSGQPSAAPPNTGGPQ